MARIAKGTKAPAKKPGKKTTAGKSTTGKSTQASKAGARKAAPPKGAPAQKAAAKRRAPARRGTRWALSGVSARTRAAVERAAEKQGVPVGRWVDKVLREAAETTLKGGQPGLALPPGLLDMLGEISQKVDALVAEREPMAAKLSEQANRAAEEMKETSGRLMESLREVSEKAGELLKEGAEAVREQAATAQEQIMEKAATMVREMRGEAKGKPGADDGEPGAKKD